MSDLELAVKYWDCCLVGQVTLPSSTSSTSPADRHLPVKNLFECLFSKPFLHDEMTGILLQAGWPVHRIAPAAHNDNKTVVASMAEEST